MDFSNKNDEKRGKMVDYLQLTIKNKKLSRTIEKSIYNYVMVY